MGFIVRTGPLLVMAAGLLGLGGCGARPADTAPAGERATEGFRAEHVEIRRHLAHVEEMVGGLGAAAPAEQKATMGRVVGFLNEHIVPHARWEERALYEVVDRQAGGGPHPFTASMRHEHRIVERWIGELAREADRPAPDAVAFMRRADNLLGLIRAHFEGEEEVLLPILDRTMTRAEFERAIGAGVHEK